MPTLYYKVFSLSGSVDESKIFPQILVYSKNKYGKNYLQSACCWQKLFDEYYKVSKTPLNFDFNAQNIVGELKKRNLSISHSKGVGALAFVVGESENFNLGIDIERVADKKNQRLLEFLNLDSTASDIDFYSAWTKYESTYKALGELSENENFKRGERYIKAFLGNTFIKEVNGESVAVSIFNIDCNLEELK